MWATEYKVLKIKKIDYYQKANLYWMIFSELYYPGTEKFLESQGKRDSQKPHLFDNNTYMLDGNFYHGSVISKEAEEQGVDINSYFEFLKKEGLEKINIPSEILK
jgi:hypothetical protein